MNARVAMTLAVVAGCTWGAPPAPTLVSVSPASAVAGTELIVTLTSEGLYSGAVVDFDAPGQSEVCEWYTVEFREPGGPTVPLRDVVRVSETTLRGRLAPDADRALFDVVVVDALGRSSTLPFGFETIKCTPPNAACEDGNDCTVGDKCGGVDRCTPGSREVDGTPCTYPCTRELVPGTCLDGVCVPEDGACGPAPSPCTPP